MDQLLLPESKIKPVGRKKRTCDGKNRQADDHSDSSDSDEDEDKSRPVIVKDNKNKPQTSKLFDLWEREGITQS